MAGPVLVVELAGPVSDEELGRLRWKLTDLSDLFIEERPGSIDLNVIPERLKVTDIDRDGSRPFVVAVAGPGFGDEDTFAAEHADLPDLEPLIGFTPTHGVSVIAMANGQVDHVITALLTVEVMAIVGGVASVEVYDRHVSTVQEMPGLLAMTPGPVPIAWGTAELLRTWVTHPAFRLVK